MEATVLRKQLYACIERFFQNFTTKLQFTHYWIFEHCIITFSWNV